MKKLLFLRLLGFVTFFTILSVLVKVLMYILISRTIGFPADTGKYVMDTSSFAGINIYLGFCYLLYPAWIEEVVFRYLPLTLCIHFEKSRKFWLLVAVGSSIVFGLVHGSWGNIFLQGVSGLLYSIVFAVISVKNAEIESFVKALITTTFLHAIHNLVFVYYW